MRFRCHVEAALFFSDGECLLQAAEFIDESEFFRLPSCPDSSLSDGIDFGVRFFSAFRCFADEVLVDGLHQFFDAFAFGGREAAVVGIKRGVCAVREDFLRQSDFVIEPFQIEFSAENADGSGECARLRDDGAGGHGDIVTPGCGGIGHGDDDRLFVLCADYLAPDEIRGEGGAAGAIHAQHDGVHQLILARLFKRFPQFAWCNDGGSGEDVVTACQNRSARIDEGNFGQFRFRLGALRGVQHGEQLHDAGEAAHIRYTPFPLAVRRVDMDGFIGFEFDEEFVVIVQCVNEVRLARFFCCEGALVYQHLDGFRVHAVASRCYHGAELSVKFVKERRH